MIDALITGAHFDDLEDALRYANGEDRSALSRYSDALDGMILNELGVEYFGDKPAPTIFSVMGIGHKVEIPGPEDEGENLLNQMRTPVSLRRCSRASWRSPPRCRNTCDTRTG